ncbi:MAG: hypothetical protein CMJ58_21280 [Planctomycetaceae bacterium]|nr:hypothetical protein [Planctomycetaceae bacterium]
MEYIYQALVGLLIGTFSAYLAVQRVLYDKWWERKWDAYSEILTALCDAAQYSEERREVYASMGEDKSEKLIARTDYIAAVWKVKRSVIVGDFVVNPAAVRVLEQLSFAAAGDWGNAPGEVLYDGDLNEYREAITNLRKIARDDLEKSVRW